MSSGDKARARPCAFLDRDGVLNVDKGYTHRVEDLEFVPGALQAVALLNARGFAVVVVTNQSGIARGMFEPADMHAFHQAMAERLAAAGARLDAIYHCPYHGDAVLPRWRHADHPDRKPNPGMLLKAFEELPIGRDGSFLIGDKPSDVAAAAAAGIPGHLFPGGRLDTFVTEIVGE